MWYVQVFLLRFAANKGWKVKAKVVSVVNSLSTMP
jgi:hypothetical protein